MAIQNGLKERVNNKLQEPKKYKVIMINDDFTTMEFVVSVLMDIFHKDQLTAEAIMLQVHKQGKAVVGVYSYDIATTKVTKALAKAKEAGFPFRMTVEED